MRSDRLRRVIGYALSRREAYLIVTLVFLGVIVAIVGRWPGWVIPASIVVGVVLLALLVIDSLSDPNVARDLSLLDIDVGRLRDPALKAKVRKALEYVRAAQELARRDTSGILNAAGDELPQMERAARSIYQVSLRLQEFQADHLLKRDQADLRQRARGSQLSSEQEAQLSTLQRLDDLTRSAEQEIDGALAHLGRSYAEMQAIKVTPELTGRASDALGELEASTTRLSELAEGYDKVFESRPMPKRS